MIGYKDKNKLGKKLVNQFNYDMNVSIIHLIEILNIFKLIQQKFYFGNIHIFMFINSFYLKIYFFLF
jgi:hypothetical protein